MSEIEYDDDQGGNERRSNRRPKRNTVRTTGILQNNLSVALTAHLDLVNLNTEDVEVRVQVLSWGTAVTQTNPVSTLLDITQFIPANTRTAFNALVTASNHYEVRLTVAENNGNVLLTTYGRTSIGGGQVVGLTVLDSQFQTIEIDTCI
ncbi:MULTISPECIES: hypothetical protein [Brevibacillus]|uniref:hypothetical protein n=1 Tax=Brevibacillus TaxID=55080 RepID=UPI000D10B1CF|nr:MULTISPECIES: hypothetical protein [Brevibacillus]PSJ68261.1 hypothetical protein C7J99_17880 [Brevibacillus brevis]RED35776.1 hypothetical protein DES34_101436 [Brevibacillus brevis]TQK53458.1 hypothetical protein FB479_11096 [Brevibacillus sp. AG162]VEF89114.1 Uncharacterised protein [Brevibacillus brevis]GEC89318.1 hypothetical protein BBR01nite_16490 [Brevibacillus brevis]